MRYRDGTLSYGADAVSIATGLLCEDVSLAQQSAVLETDINEIVRRFRVTGELPEAFRLPVVEDYDDIFDFQSAQNALVDAKRSFMQVPAEIRRRFDNDPQVFYEFCVNPDNLPELRKLGLAKEIAPDVVPASSTVVT